MMPSKNLAAAYQGEPGAFSVLAAQKLLGREVRLQPCATFFQVFERLISGDVTHAVIPIENTLYGSVPENFDLLLQYDCQILAETAIRIEHHLIAMPGAEFASIRRVYSHPVALGQCRNFFARHPQIEAVSSFDTAGSVKQVMREGLLGDAAIASEAAAHHYGGVILESNLEDNPHNLTRFFLLSKQTDLFWSVMDSGEWKTSLFFSTENKPGSLFKALSCFALRDLSLARIESRPMRSRPWEYLFYVDVLSELESIPLTNAIANLREMCGLVKVLGTYQAIP